MTNPPSPLILIAETEPEVVRCWPAFSELRPHLDRDAFVERWRAQHAEGYRIAYIADGERVAAVAGFRMLTTMAWGKIIYLDDLVAHPAKRGHGLGSALLQWLQALTRETGCAAIHLDTGYQRHAAHLAYLRNGFALDCHHLAWRVC
jgi:GNAT superfamily N-acetyltransferase